MHSYVFTLQSKKTLESVSRVVAANSAMEALQKVKVFAEQLNLTIVHMEQPEQSKTP